MTKSDERREVAERMRKEAADFRSLGEEYDHVWTVDLGDVPALLQDVAHFAGLDGTVRADELFDRLADLMDPTCEVEAIATMDWPEGTGTTVYDFSCGHSCETTRPVSPDYCPRCGARVVAGGDD